MALKDQPYLPLYIKDWMTDLELRNCSPGAAGIMIWTMCVMHKSPQYGTISTGVHPGTPLTFAQALSRHLPYTADEILAGLTELLEKGVLRINEGVLESKRMVRDNKTSESRAETGRKGAEKFLQNRTLPKDKPKQTPRAKPEEKTANANVDVNAGASKKKEIKELVFPFDTETFKAAWSIWKEYRAEKKKPIKSIISEQAALKKLGNMSNGNEATAIEIINRSLENNWEGLHELNEKHGLITKQSASNFIGEAIGISKAQTVDRLSSYSD